MTALFGQHLNNQKQLIKVLNESYENKCRKWAKEEEAVLWKVECQTQWTSLVEVSSTYTHTQASSLEESWRQ